MQVGDEVLTKKPLWYQGEDIGNRLGKIISTRSYILVHLYNFHSNPVKCTQNEVERIEREKTSMDEWFEEDLDNISFD